MNHKLYMLYVVMIDYADIIHDAFAYLIVPTYLMKTYH
jgi:hypothetical protein